MVAGIYGIGQEADTRGVQVPARTTQSAFDKALEATKTGPGVYATDIDEAWNVFRGPNGGYLAALLMKTAMASAGGDPDRRPRVLTVHYIAVAKPGPVEIRTRLLRRGSSLSWLSADLFQRGQLCVTAKLAMSTDWPSVEFSNLTPPDVSFDDATVLPPEVMPPFSRHYEYRSLYATPFDPGHGDAIGGYLRLCDPRPYDPALLAAMSDAWFPSTFAFDSTMVMGVTLDLTVHFRNHAALERLSPEHSVLSIFRSRRATEGFFEEDGELWSPDGQLIAQSRQLALAAPMAG